MAGIAPPHLYYLAARTGGPAILEDEGGEIMSTHGNHDILQIQPEYAAPGQDSSPWPLYPSSATIVSPVNLEARNCLTFDALGVISICIKFPSSSCRGLTIAVVSCRGGVEEKVRFVYFVTPNGNEPLLGTL